MQKKFFVIWLLFFSGGLSAVIIVMHGTFANGERWHQADGDFVQSLRSSFVDLPEGCGQKNAPIVSFSWTGANCSSARINAAKNLAALLISYPQAEKIYLIAHSHAGNVAALTTHLLKKACGELESSNTRGFFSSWSLTTREASDLVGLPCTQGDVAYLKKAVTDLMVLVGSNSVATRSVVFEGKKIQRIYFLGTPVDTSRYVCDMDVVDECYSLFSKGDWIQPVGGFYGRVFPQAQRFLNIEVVLVYSEKRILGLGHTDLRKPSIGRFLLMLPFLIEKSLGVQPVGYEDYKHVVLALFPDNRKPVVIPQLFETDGLLNQLLKVEIARSEQSEKSERASELDAESFGSLEKTVLLF